MPPFPRDKCVADITEAVGREEPHYHEVPGHPFGELALKPECRVKPIRKELEEREISPADSIYVVGPVDQEAAPDHQAEERHVDPVEPANRAGMLEFQALHVNSS